ncbi:Hypothetical predicted protein [Octopus vulgaris]|uniref:Uncharacterized protein n=1 Tax=Octopus vulgaris TaxID=6645 RepID=A0AA36BMV7_OCTVU|nr:Hypothetical predicted protein [Octopus vulgaris]
MVTSGRESRENMTHCHVFLSVKVKISGIAKTPKESVDAQNGLELETLTNSLQKTQNSLRYQFEIFTESIISNIPVLQKRSNITRQ